MSTAGRIHHEPASRLRCHKTENQRLVCLIDLVIINIAVILESHQRRTAQEDEKTTSNGIACCKCFLALVTLFTSFARIQELKLVSGTTTVSLAVEVITIVETW